MVALAWSESWIEEQYRGDGLDGRDRDDVAVLRWLWLAARQRDEQCRW